MSIASLIVFPSAARTAVTTASPEYAMNHAGYGRATCDITAAPGVDTLTFEVQGKDKASGKWFTVLASAALSAAGTVQLEIGPGVAAAANAAADKLLPEVFRVVATNSSATGSSFTYSVGFEYLY